MLKLLLGDGATRKDDKVHMMLSDLKRAYFNAECNRELYVELPHEDPHY